jgi:2-keto-4-pentenoate hydratase/2-oxohepta-3-ene-1,7-dioic acid hydratase in catechol pathway
MRVGAARLAGGVQLVLEDGGLHRLDFGGDLRALIESGVDPRELATGSDVTGAVLDAPLRPGKIVAIGFNYKDHLDEAGATPPERPMVFTKFTSSITGPTDPIILHPLAERVDWEVELALVIGRRMREVAADEALDYVFGYTVANDVSARDVQFADGQFVRGKSFDTFCPTGPVVVTADEIGEPQALALRTRVNGETVQESSTSQMLFGVRELLEFCSHSFPLDPGDLVLTGTPWGCGEFMDPQRSLAAGDVVETEVERIGTLRNEVRGPA